MALIDYSSSPHAKRVRELRVDRMLSRLYFNYGLRHYVSWSEKPEYRYALIQSASSIDNGLRLRMFNVEYAVTSHEETDSTAGLHFAWLKLTADDRTVYEGKYLEIGEYDDLPLVSVARFEEGEWLRHFRALVDEAKEARLASDKRTHLDETSPDYVPETTEDEFYGYSLTLAQSSESQCEYGHDTLFACPLAGSEHTLNFADGPGTFRMCDYHWVRFCGTITSATKESSSDAPSNVELKKVPRPRRCEWDVCAHLVGEALVMPSRLPGIPVEYYFCEQHRPLFLNWVNDRTKKVKLRLGPQLRKKVQLWPASRHNQRRQPNEEQ